MPDEAPEGDAERDADPLADLSARAQQYAGIWRSAIERNAQGAYKPEDWFDDVNRTWAMVAEDAARAFAALVDAAGARGAVAGERPEGTSGGTSADPSADG
jgi:hypothetical protein